MSECTDPIAVVILWKFCWTDRSSRHWICGLPVAQKNNLLFSIEEWAMRHVPRMITSFPCLISGRSVGIGLSVGIKINFFFNSSKFLMIRVSASGEPNGANVSRAWVRNINTTSPMSIGASTLRFCNKNKFRYLSSACECVFPVQRTHVKHTKNIERIKIHRITLNNCAVCCM